MNELQKEKVTRDEKKDEMQEVCGRKKGDTGVGEYSIKKKKRRGKCGVQAGGISGESKTIIQSCRGSYAWMACEGKGTSLGKWRKREIERLFSVLL